MSNHVNEQYLEDKYEEGLELGMTEEEAEAYAYRCLEQEGQ